MRSLPEIKAKSLKLNAKDILKEVCNNRRLAALFAVIISEVLADTGGFAVSNRGENEEQLLKETENVMTQMILSDCHYSKFSHLLPFFFLDTYL